MNIDSIRKNYAITAHDIYLNHAATTPIANTSIAKIQALAEQMRRPLGEHFYVWLGLLEDTRRRLAELINAHASEIAFCQNTSTGLSLIANAITFNPGDIVIVPSNEFPSNIYIWQSLATKGVQFRFFDVVPGVPVVETLSKLDLTHVRLLSISAVSYYTGRLYDLIDISRFCRERDILFCIDAIQAIGATPIDVQVIQSDFMASGAQKWLLGSVGAGFIYAKKEFLNKLQVPLVGWTSVKYPEDFSLKSLDFSPEMTRFEPGLPDILPIGALNESLRDLSGIGWKNIYEIIGSHTEYLIEQLNSKNIKVFSGSDKTAGIVSFEIPRQYNPDFLLKKMAQEKIHITYRNNYIRVSPHFYNTKAELDYFLKIFDIAAKKLIIKSQAPIVAETTKKHILIIGATGTIGSAFARKLSKEGNRLTLVGRDLQKLTALQSEVEASIKQVDLTLPEQLSKFCRDLTDSNQRFDALIYCAGLAEIDEFNNLDVDKFKSMMQVNCIAAFELMKLFLTRLATPNAMGILTIVSASGRCGFPLFSGYAASNAALWSMGEVLARELSSDNRCIITTYVAPPIHSRMQKRIGRNLLRYFKLSGTFPYKHDYELVDEAWDSFKKRKSIFISKSNRLMLWLNTLFPKIIERRIKRVWKK